MQTASSPSETMTGVDAQRAEAFAAATRIGHGALRAHMERIRGAVQVRPQLHLRASSFGHPCDRKLYLDIAEWERAKPLPERAYRNFARGNALEPIIIRMLGDYGYRVLAEQTDWHDATLNMSGRCEGFIADNETGQRILTEIKQTTGHFLSELRRMTDEEMLDADPGMLVDILRGNEYGEGYYTQTQIYMYLNSVLSCVLFVLDVPEWRLLPIPIPFDWDFGDAMIKRAKDINLHLEVKEPPAFCQKVRVCQRCSHFKHLCFPPIDTGEVEIITDADIIADLDRWDSLVANGKQFNKVDRRLKEALRTVAPRCAAGDWIIERTESARRVLELPKEVRAQYTVMGTAVKTVWHRAGADRKGDEES